MANWVFNSYLTSNPSNKSISTTYWIVINSSLYPCEERLFSSTSKLRERRGYSANVVSKCIVFSELTSLSFASIYYLPVPRVGVMECSILITISRSTCHTKNVSLDWLSSWLTKYLEVIKLTKTRSVTPMLVSKRCSVVSPATLGHAVKERHNHYAWIASTTNLLVNSFTQ